MQHLRAPGRWWRCAAGSHAISHAAGMLTVVDVGRREASISMLDRGPQSKALKSYAGATELLLVVLIGSIFTRLVPLPGIPRDDSVLSVVSRVIAHNEVREPLQMSDVAQPWGRCPTAAVRVWCVASSGT